MAKYYALKPRHLLKDQKGLQVEDAVLSINVNGLDSSFFKIINELLSFQVKICHTFPSSTFPIIVCFSLFYIIFNWAFLGFRLLVGQKNWITLCSGNLSETFSTIFYTQWLIEKIIMNVFRFNYFNPGHIIAWKISENNVKVRRRCGLHWHFSY